MKYTYKCDVLGCLQCGEEFELEYPMGQPGRVRCGSCHEFMRRVINSAPEVHYTGSGFYATDLASDDVAASQRRSDKRAEPVRDEV